MKITIQKNVDSGELDMVLTDREGIGELAMQLECALGKVDVMNPQLILPFLAFLGIKEGQLEAQKANELGSKLLESYPPMLLAEQNVYTRAELNCLQFSYLTKYCKVLPVSALKISSDFYYWRNFFPDTETTYEFEKQLHKLSGDTELIELAAPMRLRQIIDLMILKTAVEQNSRKLIDKRVVNERITASNNNLAKVKEIVIAYIEALILRPHAEDWLVQRDLSKYTFSWLQKIWNQAGDDLDERQRKFQGTSTDCLVKYPILIVSGCNTLEASEDQTCAVQVANSKLMNVLAYRLLDTIEVMELPLVEYFLIMTGVKLGKFQLAKAGKLAKQALKMIKPSFKNNNLYKRSDLFEVYFNYLLMIDRDDITSEDNANEEFWRAIFPDTKPVCDFLPKLVGEPEKIKLAEISRDKEVLDLLLLKEQLTEVTEQLLNTYPSFNKEAWNAHCELINAQLDQIINRNQAEDWLTTTSVRYTSEWLKAELEPIWNAAKQLNEHKDKAKAVS